MARTRKEPNVGGPPRLVSRGTSRYRRIPGTQQNSPTVALHRLPPGPTFLGEGATSDFAEWSPRVRNDVGAVVRGMAGPTGQIPDATLYQIYYLYAARAASTNGEDHEQRRPDPLRMCKGVWRAWREQALAGARKT